MPDFEEFKLGDREFKIRRPTLKQLRSITPLVEKLATPMPVPEIMDTSVEVIVLACKRDYPELTADEVWDLETNLTEVSTAVGIICRHSGFVKGEAPAGS